MNTYNNSESNIGAMDMAQSHPKQQILKSVVVNLLKTLLLFSLAAVFVACGSKKDSKKSNANSRLRNYDPDRNSNLNGVNQNTGAVWGAITNNNPQFSALVADMLGVSGQDFGGVSGSPNANTGVRFEGQVDEQSASGYLNVLVWDQYANQGAEPYYWQMQVAAVRSDQTRGYVEFSDGIGKLIFNGTFQGNNFNGVVTYDNRASGGRSNQLGNFSIYACGFFVCR